MRVPSGNTPFDTDKRAPSSVTPAPVAVTVAAAPVSQAGPGAGLYGAKITGGGSGGTVAVLGRADAGQAVEAIARQYARESGLPSHVFSSSSPGACRVAVRIVANP